MDNEDQLEKRIAVLMEELGDAIYPITRGAFINGQEWLDFLEEIKREKDSGSTQWQKMRRWD